MLKFAELCVNLHPKLDKKMSMKKIKTMCMLLAATLGMVSCTSTDSIETTLYSDAAITAFTLGNLNQYTQSTGSNDSVITTKTTFSALSYRFHINQRERSIYNTDSLPVGTDVSHVLCNITTANNSAVFYLNLADTLYYYYSSSDSIDFSSPCKFRVISSSGTGYTDYTVQINVHKEKGDVFNWQLMTDVELPSAPTLPTGIKTLLGSSTTEQYALSDDNKLMVSHDGEATWEQDIADNAEDADKMPTQDIALVSYPMSQTDKTDYVLLAGTRKVKDGTSQEEYRTAVWRKIVDYSGEAPASSWTYMERSGKEKYNLPYLQHLSLVKYDDAILAFGGDYQTIYQSRDNGITWQVSKQYQMPIGFNRTATSVTAVVDKDNYIWLYCYGTGEVWRGRLNRLGWAKQ